jgi:signal transduction histidine kinase
VLRRIDAMTETTKTIMAGDLGGRLPVAGTGDELDRLAENLNAMLERIEALMRGLKEVTDNIAHDLKTPLTRMRNRCEQALRGERGQDYRAALEATIAESDDLIRTFDALLMIARAESGQARGNMDDFDAAEVANGIHELYEPLAEDDGMSLRVRTQPVQIHANRELISQALANLVENAIKYGKPVAQAQGSVVSLDAKQILIEARREGDSVLLSVTDHGVGIPEADRKHAVERFVRLDTSRTQPGSGLGLSLASAVAILHGGELRLGDAHPGLVATLVIPARAGASDRLAAPAQDMSQKVA